MEENKIIFNLKNPYSRNSKNIDQLSDNYFVSFPKTIKLVNKFDLSLIKLLPLFYDILDTKYKNIQKYIKLLENDFFNYVFNEKLDDFFLYHCSKYNSQRKKNQQKTINLKEYKQEIKKNIYKFYKKANLKNTSYQENIFNFFTFYKDFELRHEKLAPSNKSNLRIILLQKSELKEYWGQFVKIINSKSIILNAEEANPIWASILSIIILNREFFIGYENKKIIIKGERFVKEYSAPIYKINCLFSLFNFYFLFFRCFHPLLRKYFFYKIASYFKNSSIQNKILKTMFSDNPEDLSDIYILFLEELIRSSKDFYRSLKTWIKYGNYELKNNIFFKSLKNKYPDASDYLLIFLYKLVNDNKIIEEQEIYIKDFINLTNSSYETARKNFLYATNNLNFFRKKRQNDNKTLVFVVTKKAVNELKV